MKKPAIWIILGVIVVALIIYFATMSGDNSTSNQTVDSNQTQNTNEQAQMEASSTPASLKELMARSSSTRCEFSASEDSNNSSGVVYAANGKARVDFSSTTNDKTTSGHMIMDNEMAYTWIDGQAKGFKVSTATAMSAQPNQPNEKQFDPEKKLDYRCENWSGDSTIFTVPANIEFTDINAMMPSAQGGVQGSMTPSTPTQSAQCAACDQAPEASRAQCRAALGCK